jgi:hypothetical protein
MPKAKDRKSKTRVVELLQSGYGFLIFAFSILIFTLLFAGCQRKQAEDVDMLAWAPDAQTLHVPSDYAVRALDVTGGLDAWTKTKKLQLDCVVTFYQPDGSFYLSEQHYEVYPWTNSIRISAVEPQGQLVWQWSKGQFNPLKGGEQFDGLPAAVPGRCLAEVILNVVTAPVRFADAPVEFAKGASSIKMQGQLYEPIARRRKPDFEPPQPLSAAFFYQNVDTFLVDTLWFPRMSGEDSLRIRGYDYTAVEKGGVVIPAKIEIFGTDAQGDSQKRLVEIDCHTLKRTK